MSTPPAPNQGAVASPAPVVNGGRQIAKPIKRYLPFSSMKPAFISSEDYHSFNTPAGAAADVRNQEPEAIVVKSPVSLFLYSSNQFNCFFIFFKEQFLFTYVCGCTMHDLSTKTSFLRPSDRFEISN